jgi:GDPmannose 4,6-dehydratase
MKISKRKTRALIIGIAGQDGILLADALLAKGYEVVGFGRRASILSRMELKGLLDRVELFYGDLDDPEDIIDAIKHHQPDEIYNLAAQSAPGLSWARSIETGSVTGIGAHRVFEAVRRFKPDCRLYHASSSEMFGVAHESPQNEGTPFNPVNPYATAKVYAHHIASIYRKSYGIFICCGILFNHESPYRNMHFLTQKVAYGAACAKLGILDSVATNEAGEPIVRAGKLSLGNLDASRDWGSAKDYAQAMWLMLQQPNSDDYVIGTGVLRTVRDLCQVAYSHVGLDWCEHVISDSRFVRPIETSATIADAAKARRVLGWAPVIAFEEIIGEMVDARLAVLQNTIE